MAEIIKKGDTINQKQLADMPDTRSYEWVFNQFEDQINPPTLELFAEKINSGYSPIIVSNHQSHADGIAVSLITQKLKEKCPQLKGFYLPIAASMLTGHQGTEVKYLLEKFNPHLLARGIEAIPVTREKDKSEYQITNPNVDSLIKIATFSKNNYGLAIFPEGSIQGGRKKGDGTINGMIQVEDNDSLGKMITKMINQGGNFAVLPIAIDGSYQLFDPTDKKLVPVLAKIPIKSSKILFKEDFDSKDVSATEIIMHQIASELSPEAAGHYKL